MLEYLKERRLQSGRKNRDKITMERDGNIAARKVTRMTSVGHWRRIRTIDPSGTNPGGWKTKKKTRLTN